MEYLAARRVPAQHAVVVAQAGSSASTRLAAEYFLSTRVQERARGKQFRADFPERHKSARRLRLGASIRRELESSSSDWLRKRGPHRCVAVRDRREQAAGRVDGAHAPRRRDGGVRWTLAPSADDVRRDQGVQLAHACRSTPGAARPSSARARLFAVARRIDLVSEDALNQRPPLAVACRMSVPIGMEGIGMSAARKEEETPQRLAADRHAEVRRSGCSTGKSAPRSEREIVVPGNPTQPPALRGIAVQVVVVRHRSIRIPVPMLELTASQRRNEVDVGAASRPARHATGSLRGA